MPANSFAKFLNVVSRHLMGGLVCVGLATAPQAWGADAAPKRAAVTIKKKAGANKSQRVAGSAKTVAKVAAAAAVTRSSFGQKAGLQYQDIQKFLNENYRIRIGSTRKG